MAQEKKDLENLVMHNDADGIDRLFGQIQAADTQVTFDGAYYLNLGIRHGAVDAVQKMLEYQWPDNRQNFSPDQLSVSADRGDLGSYPLISAIHYQCCVDLLLQHGANPNMPLTEATTPGMTDFMQRENLLFLQGTYTPTLHALFSKTPFILSPTSELSGPYLEHARSKHHANFEIFKFIVRQIILHGTHEQFGLFFHGVNFRFDEATQLFFSTIEVPEDWQRTVDVALKRCKLNFHVQSKYWNAVIRQMSKESDPYYFQPGEIPKNLHAIILGVAAENYDDKIGKTLSALLRRVSENHNFPRFYDSMIRDVHARELIQIHTEERSRDKFRSFKFNNLITKNVTESEKSAWRRLYMNMREKGLGCTISANTRYNPAPYEGNSIIKSHFTAKIGVTDPRRLKNETCKEHIHTGQTILVPSSIRAQRNDMVGPRWRCNYQGCTETCDTLECMSMAQVENYLDVMEQIKQLEASVTEETEAAEQEALTKIYEEEKAALATLARARRSSILGTKRKLSKISRTMDIELNKIKRRRSPYLAKLEQQQAAERKAQKELDKARSDLQKNRETGLHDRLKRLRF